jgi:hypothetical protein
MTEYFSDKELGKKQPIIEEISTDVWNGIVAIFEEYKTNNYFSSTFPEKCYDNNSQIVGFCEELFNDRVKSEIPAISIPIQRKQVENTSITNWGTPEPVITEITEFVDKYSTLDFLEFLCRNFKTPIKKDYHAFFKHYHLNFENDIAVKQVFEEKINQLFERNGVVFILKDCQISRRLPKEFLQLIRDYKTEDAKLNELINSSLVCLKSAKIEERLRALEKIWDAFERMKTYYKELKKNQSIEQLLELASGGDANIKEELDKEAKELTRIGNEYQIRHFETNKKEINQLELVDYLFFRMLAFIHLVVTKLEK